MPEFNPILGFEMPTAAERATQAAADAERYWKDAFDLARRFIAIPVPGREDRYSVKIDRRSIGDTLRATIALALECEDLARRDESLE